MIGNRQPTMSITMLATCLLVVALSTASCGLAAPSADSEFDLVKEGTLTIGTYGVFAPVVTYSGNDLTGVTGLLFNTFAEEHDLGIEIHETTFSSLVLAVQQGTVDVGLYFYYTPERAEQVRYSLPFLVDENKIYTREDFPYDGPDSLATVASVQGYALADTLMAALGDRLVLYPSSATAATATLNGLVDGFVAGSSGLYPEPLTPENANSHTIPAGTWGLEEEAVRTLDYNIYSCGGKALADAVDAHFSAMWQDGRWSAGLAELGVEPYDLELTPPDQGCP